MSSSNLIPLPSRATALFRVPKDLYAYDSRDTNVMSWGDIKKEANSNKKKSKKGKGGKNEPTTDDEEGYVLSKEEREQRRAALAMKIRKEQEDGPPPNMAKRQLIFDALSKIISKTYAKVNSRSQTGDTRGTYIFTWGAGYHGQLGRHFERGRKKYATIPKVIYLDMAVRQVSCGGLHTALVTDDGRVYTFGDARSSQLGYQPHGFTNQPTPRLVEALEGHVFVTHVACGQSHTVALTDKGHLISWGMSRFGQCGHNDRQIVKTPRKIRLDDPTVKFVDVSAGDKHTVALSSKGIVFSFGCAQQGQLGHDESPPVDKLKPTPVASLATTVFVTSVVCGAIHTACVTDRGQLYVMGFGEHFYPDENINFFMTPTLIPFPDSAPIVQVACGQAHIVALTDKGDVYTWGSGSYGQLGYGVKGDLNVPRLVLTGKAVAQVSAGRYHSIALTSFGTLFSWGCGESGQLGHHNDENVFFPKVIEPNIGTVVGQVACGEHHTAVLTSTPWAKADDEVLEWLHAEREEYALKEKYLKRTNHGLVKKDLLKIQQRMNELKAQWLAEKRAQQEQEKQEQAKDIASIRRRESLLEDIMKTNADRESKRGTAYTIGDGVLPSPTADDEEKEDNDDERKPSKSAPLSFSRHSAIPKLGDSSKPSTVLGARHASGMSGDGTTATLLSSTLNKAAPSEPKKLLFHQHAQVVDKNNVITSGLSGANAARSGFLRESSLLVTRMKHIIADSGDTSTQARLKKMIQMVFGFRKDYDELKNIVRKKTQIVHDLQQQYDILYKNTHGTKSRKRMTELLLKALKMKLSTVTIKITETEENRKNYALNIAHLKEEEFERYYQLEALRKQSTAVDVMIRKMNEMKMATVEERERCELEVEQFRDEIEGFHTFIHEQLRKFQTISEMAQSRLAKRQAEKAARSAKVHDRIAARVTKLSDELKEKNEEAIAMAQQLESVHERLRYFEKRFQQIASTTGLTNPDAIINKFTLKEEIREELKQEIRVKESQMDEMRAALLQLQQQRDVTKTHFTDSKWKDVDDLMVMVQKEESKAKNAQLDAERGLERIAYVREGMVALFNLIPLELLPIDPDMVRQLEGGDTSYESTMELCHLLESTLVDFAQRVETKAAEYAEAQRIKRERDMLADRHSAAQLAADVAEKMRISQLMRRNSAMVSNHKQKQRTFSQQQPSSHAYGNPYSQSGSHSQGHGDSRSYANNNVQVEEGDEDEEREDYEQDRQDGYQLGQGRPNDNPYGIDTTYANDPSGQSHTMHRNVSMDSADSEQDEEGGGRSWDYGLKKG